MISIRFIEFLCFACLNISFTSLIKDASLQTFSKQSECEDWCKQGENFFRKKRFDLAEECFKEGSDILKARLARAYHEKQLAR